MARFCSSAFLTVLFYTLGGLSPVLGLPAVNTTVSARPMNPLFGQPGFKVGLAWPNGPTHDATLVDVKTPHVIGLYTYGVDKPATADSLGLDFYPMLWGGDSDRIAAFESAFTGTDGLGTLVLGFNEPNELNQSNLDPATGATLWKAHIEPKVALGYKTASPAVSSADTGKPWAISYFEACDTCTIDYLALHWYGAGFDDMVEYLTSFHEDLGLPILLTEYGLQGLTELDEPTLRDVLDFTEQALKFFDETDWIVAAFPYGFGLALNSSSPNALQNADGTLTELGSLIVNDGQ